MTPIFMRIWLMKMTSVLVRLMLEVSFLRAWLISRACRPICGSPISPSISALGVSAAPESITITSTDPERDIQAERAGRYHLHVLRGLGVHFHDGALAELLFDLRQGGLQGLGLAFFHDFPFVDHGIIPHIKRCSGRRRRIHVPRRSAQPKQETCLLVAPSRQPSRGASPLERADETAVDLDFYTVPKEMQAPKTNQGLRQASAEGFAGGPGIRGARPPGDA